MFIFIITSRSDGLTTRRRYNDMAWI